MKRTLATLVATLAVILTSLAFAAPAEAAKRGTVRESYSPPAGHVYRSVVHYRVGRYAVRIPKIVASYDMAGSRQSCSDGTPWIRVRVSINATNDDRVTIKVPCRTDTTHRVVKRVGLVFPAINPCFIGECPPRADVRSDFLRVFGGPRSGFTWYSPWTEIS